MVLVESEIVGFVLVPQTTPLAVMAAPPSEETTPPLDAVLEVIELIPVVELIAGMPSCAGLPIMFT